MMTRQAQEATGVRARRRSLIAATSKAKRFLACEAYGRDAARSEAADLRRQGGRPVRQQDFVYDAGEDVYRCPAGEKLTWRYWNVEAGRKLHNYWTTKCTGCALKSKCTPAKERRVKRWEHEAVLDAMQERLDRTPKTMRIRRQTAEHPFGTIKAWMGATIFRLTLEKVRTGDEPSRSRVQSEADDCHPRGPAAHPGDEGRLSPSPYENLTRQQTQPRLGPLPHGLLSIAFCTASVDSARRSCLEKDGVRAKAAIPLRARKRVYRP